MGGWSDAKSGRGLSFRGAHGVHPRERGCIGKVVVDFKAVLNGGFR